MTFDKYIFGTKNPATPIYKIPGSSVKIISAIDTWHVVAPHYAVVFRDFEKAKRNAIWIYEQIEKYGSLHNYLKETNRRAIPIQF